MENIQEKYANLFKHSCYCFCLCKMFSGTDNEWMWLQYIAEGVQLGFIDEDCYVAKPLQFIELISEYSFKDIQKVPLKKLEDLPKGNWIVELQQPNGKDSHFVITNNKGMLIFDPSGISKSWTLGKTISYRKYIGDNYEFKD